VFIGSVFFFIDVAILMLVVYFGFCTVINTAPAEKYLNIEKQSYGHSNLTLQRDDA